MSKHNRERRALWKLGLHKRQIARRIGATLGRPMVLALHHYKVEHEVIQAARAALNPQRKR